MTNGPPRRRTALWYLIFAVPTAAVLWVPSYNTLEPRLGGIPFFYWYQFVWIFLAAVLTALVYRVTR